MAKLTAVEMDLRDNYVKLMDQKKKDLESASKRVKALKSDLRVIKNALDKLGLNIDILDEKPS